MRKFKYVSVRRAFSSEEFENADSVTTKQIILIAVSRFIIIIIPDFCILASVCLSSYPAGEEEATGKHYFSSSYLKAFLNLKMCSGNRFNFQRIVCVFTQYVVYIYVCVFNKTFLAGAFKVAKLWFVNIIVKLLQ